MKRVRRMPENVRRLEDTPKTKTPTYAAHLWVEYQTYLDNIY
ncbi:MAG: hypothetical protein ACI8XX_000772 [Polaribacter sp.]|jgi:hypothetical protein